MKAYNEKNKLRLWYDRPSTAWTQGLPIGNGSLGAVICGGGESETWHMTESTYWSGKPERTPSRSRGKADLERMRQLFFAGDFESGERLVGELLQPEKGNFGTNVALCDMRLRFGHSESRFVRELSLEEAIVSVSYESEGVKYEREIFASHAHGIVASLLRCDEAGALSFSLELEGRSESFSVRESENGDSLLFSGIATESVHSDGRCGVLSRGIVKVAVNGGSVRAAEGKLIIEKADEALIVFAASTDYERSDDRWMEEPEFIAKQVVTAGFESLKEAHVADYRELFARVEVELGVAVTDAELASLPTDQRLARLRESRADDPQLYVLFYQYARYLTIAGSREDSRLPMHLQGIWNDGEASRMAWSCDYHLDVNTQMNYYPAETGNLAECHKPLMRFVERLSVAGKEAAQDFYGCEGWVAHVFTNAWGFTAPGWHYSWGLNVTGGLWLAAQLQEHYEFGGNGEADLFLKDTAYPVLKGAAEFYLDYMTIHPANGRFVTGPANSPENSFYPDETGKTSRALSMGPVMDTMLVRELFAFCAKASRKLGTDEAFREKLEQALPLLAPLAVGRAGQLQEWLEDYGEAQPDHRHLSHLYGLYPGSEITPDLTPELADAARITLDNRQRGSNLEDVEFTLALFAAGRARLRDGDKAREHLSYLIGELCFDNLLTFSKPGIAGAEAYIFVADGNFGGAAAIAEMLLQSHAGEIHVLPAIPAGWQQGRFSGLRARGGAEADVTWKHGRLTGVTVKAHAPLQTKLRYEDRIVRLDLAMGESVSFDGMLTEIARERK
ncbi:glycoside hydrolase family 95 protein [Cohnella endophytica]|uniref:Glycoside hydrolase family 95 protein n=1 Tax=Cohnella endophytica TaxID=2419778 RepID=A0A494Y1M3_9BACL|nr:glycoside hydrolase family 95 protein [Cohnella endophytica]RKP54337.1 glycoside hydrolase family 95 protein [Cohnella endophytica]